MRVPNLFLGWLAPGIFFVAALGAVSCGGASEVVSGNSTVASGSGAGNDSGETSGALSNDGLPQPAEITIDLSQARAFLIQNENSPIDSDESDAEDADAVESASSAQEAENGTGVETNFWTLDGDGNLRPAVTVEGGVNVKRIEIERIDTAPTGEIYFLFAHTVSVKGEYCKWIVANADAPDSAECADPDTRFEFAQIKFAHNGTVYYSDVNGQIRIRGRINKQIRTLFTGADIDFDLEAFVPAPDGSIMIVGDLTGTSQRFFRLLSDSDEDGSVTMEAPCIESVKAKTKGSVPGNEMFVSTAGELYVKSTRDVCDELPESLLYRGVFSGDELVFSPIEGVNADFFAEDSTGRVYAVKKGGDGDPSTIARVDGAAPYDSVIVPLDDVQTMRVIGDEVYVTGENGSGRGAFLRRSLASENDDDWADLLAGGDFVIQEFQADADGAVYFGAVDYDDAATRKLFRYDASEDSLEPIAALPEDLKEIVFIGADGTDPFGLNAL